VLYTGLCKEQSCFKGKAFIALRDYVKALVESEYYAELNERLEELTNRVREIKSVTIGVNLDAQLRPREAGVLSVNPESFRSGDTLHKILRLNFKEDEYTCIANLVPFGKKQSENQKTALSLAFNSAINDVYRQSLRSWKKIVQTYVLENTDFLLNLLPEFEFLLKGTNLMRALRVKGNALCIPEVASAEARAFTATALYNPAVALKVDDPIVTNDVIFDENAGIYVLTGPNRGGKSVITCAVGLAQAMLQLGLFLPAEKATISPADAIFTHFPTGADDTIDKGRLGEECARLGDIFAAISEKSLVLLDESLSSTGSFEASYIAAEVLAGLSRVGCRCIFSTHLHELAAEIDNINERTRAEGGVPIDTLVAGIEKEGRRSFRILRAKPDGKSYARDIATKYGLTYDNIIKTISQSKGE
jgi:DNA mismatch repair ATPase MutS